MKIKTMLSNVMKWIARAALFLVCLIIAKKTGKAKPPKMKTEVIGGNPDKAEEGKEILDGYEE